MAQEVTVGGLGHALSGLLEGLPPLCKLRAQGGRVGPEDQAMSAAETEQQPFLDV